ncbi:MAG: hypothetical protein L0I66_02540 [Tetragenococcus halophilus]|nr:hypothetical protein [Tetragenococcus halophilus]
MDLAIETIIRRWNLHEN